MTTTIGSGLGGAVIVAPQNTWGGDPVFTSARTIPIKSAKATQNPHPLQGGPYLRYGQYFDIGSARTLLYQSHTMPIVGDVMSTGHALLLATAFATDATLQQLGTTTAYALGGTDGFSPGDPIANSTYIDLQQDAPTTDATVYSYTYHSGLITKAEWTFDRTAYVAFSYDTYFQQMETETELTAPSEPAAPIPFSMGGTSPIFKMGAYGEEATVDGIKKVTVTLERKVTTDRIYVGEEYVDAPVMNDNGKLTVALEWDNTPDVNTSVAPLMMAGTPTSIIVGAVGPQIGTSSYTNLFQLNATNCFLDTGGEQTLDGPAVISGTASFSGTLNAAGDPVLQGVLQTADIAF